MAAPAFLSLISGLQIISALGVLAKHYGIGISESGNAHKQNCQWGDISEPHGEVAARPAVE